MVSLSCRISPRTSTVIFCDRSPLATAMVTSAMLRTWPVRFDAIELTLSVRSFHVPATPGTTAWPPSLPSVPTSRATRVTSDANAFSWSTIVLMVFLSSRISPLTSTVILRDRSPRATAVVDVGDVAHLAGQVRRHRVDVVGQVLPRAGDAAARAAWPPSLPSVPTSRATRRDFRRERVELVDHRVDGVLELEDLALDVDRDLRDRSPLATAVVDFGDVAHLAGQVRRHRVDVVGQVLPRAGDAGDVAPGRRACPRCRPRARRGVTSDANAFS